jgi:hypothetical protein
MAKLKVFGGNGMSQGKQLRTIVAVPSKKAAAEALNVSVSAISNWYSVTGNPEEVEAATEQPGVVLARPLDYAKNIPFRPLSEIK